MNAQEYRERVAMEILLKGEKKMSANDKQIGGDHYKKVEGGEEHWDRQWRMNGRGYFVGCITKYVERYPYKNGVQDLEKALHFLEKLIELEKAKRKEQTELKPMPMTVTCTTKYNYPSYKVTPISEPDKHYTNQDL